MKPQPRPALKRADDADLHPALTVAPAQMPVPRGKESAGDTVTTVTAAGKPNAKKFRSPGHTTSDVLRGGKPAKKARLDVKIPKSLRKQVKQVAKHSGTAIDDIVTKALTDWLGDPRRW